MGIFITFEGGEGCGKSYQSGELYRRLLANNTPVILTHEPGGTLLGEIITKWLKWHKEFVLSATGELLLFNASRNQLCNEIVAPALGEGKVVLCDRFADSTIAYQGYGRGLDFDIIHSLNRLATDGLKPVLTILLDIPVDCGLARKGKISQDRFESEGMDFHERVRQGYLQMAKDEPQRFFVVDATLAKETIADIIWQKVTAELSKYK